MTYPYFDIEKRTDKSFRERKDPVHHKEKTPLENLPIDMVNDFPVADPLHLIDFGIMKKCLLIWTRGSKSYTRKFLKTDLTKIDSLLTRFKYAMPSELHRAVRPIQQIAHWKALEYRSFLLYLGIVVLKEVLPSDVYKHFLLLFGAITVLSCKKYVESYINIADELLKSYLEFYIEIYGIDSITSNVHNICHITDDVRRFGPLHTISTYPFENTLHGIKLLIRNGNRQLAQIAKRLLERDCEIFKSDEETQEKYPVVKQLINSEHQLEFCVKAYNQIRIKKNLLLANDNRNRYFMTINGSIIAMKNATLYKNKAYIFGESIKNKTAFFEKPFNSTFLNIFSSDGEKSTPLLYPPECVKYKMVALNLNDQLIFIPLIHTIDD